MKTGMYWDRVREMEKQLIPDVLKRHEYNLSHASAELGIHRATLRTIIRENGIQIPEQAIKAAQQKAISHARSARRPRGTPNKKVAPKKITKMTPADVLARRRIENRRIALEVAMGDELFTPPESLVRDLMYG